VAVTAIAEVSEQTRRTVPAAGARVYPVIAEMLDAETLDGVLIVVPTDRHLQVITEVAARGLPILCEKPCGLTVTQTQAAVATAQAAGLPFQVAYWRRYVPSLRALRERIAAGELGTVHLVACYQWDDRPPSDEFRAHSGGIFADMGVHEFDQMRWLTGQEIVSLAAVVSGLVPGGLIRHVPGQDPRRYADVDSAQVIAELSGGSCGIVSLGRFYPAGDMARAEAFGEEGTVRCDFLDPAEGERAQLAALREQAESFADFASGGTCTGATGADAVAALDAATRAGAAVPALSAT
jgi:myo-inositol 2-dehydrogenase/D-chiro-inositol 1-dehydrogenase